MTDAPLDAPASPQALSLLTGDDHRGRLLEGLAQALAHRSYHDVTIADVVAAARVSKRTFYEQFSSKEDCLLALCEAVSEDTLRTIATHFTPNLEWEAQLDTVVRAYLGRLQLRPALIRALFIELLAIGARGLKVRRDIGRRFADFLCMQVEIVKLQRPAKHSLDPAVAMAVVGGINDLILQAIEDDAADQLVERVARPAAEFVKAVMVYLERDLP
ncbi:TetR/AcrR family transcriptional regulator [Aquabacterium sp.]|uniref:TetR/AcrR family transcriptional regulator n=1 Tax=Aquabacterium sp. TaxID=1872578 RepID=UPI0035AF8FBB